MKIISQHISRAGLHAPFLTFAAFFVLVCLMGGSARVDIQSLVILRPAAIVFAAIAATMLTMPDLHRIGFPFWVLIALVATMILQLIPLPQGLWEQLPERAVFAELGKALGLDAVARPLTITPARTWNSLFALSVPLAAFLLLAMLKNDNRKKVWVLLVIAGLVSSVWGALQLFGGGGSALYTYHITNGDSPVGMFANRNHQAVFLSVCLLTSAWLFRSAKSLSQKDAPIVFLSLLSLAVTLPMILLSGSRAGLITAVISVLGWAYFLSQSPTIPDHIHFGKKRTIGKGALIGIGLAFTAMMGLLLLILSGGSALSRMVQSDTIDEVRLKTLPTITKMAGDQFVFGSGYGSFEALYKMYEPDALLGPRYLNQAHNDWLQWVIEGGLAGLVILTLVIAWIARKAWQTLRMQQGTGRDQRLMAVGCLAIIGVASIVDYPLRTPIFMVVASCALWCLVPTRPCGQFADGLAD